MIEDYFKQLPAAVTITDKDSIIVYMNEKAKVVFANEGGEALLGANLLECHNPNSQKIIKDILETGVPNSYTIEKNGIKKFIYQAPWYNEENQIGLIEISCEIPFDLPHFIRG